MTNQTKQKKNTHNTFAGRTKNDIRHAYFCANLFGTTVEEQLQPVIFDDSHYTPKKLPDDLCEFLEMLKEQLDF